MKEKVKDYSPTVAVLIWLISQLFTFFTGQGGELTKNTQALIKLNTQMETIVKQVEKIPYMENELTSHEERLKHLERN